jgi:hypothetical protein
LFDLVRQLPKRLRRVIVGRYGLGEDPPCLLKELGEELNLTRERVRQLQQDALAWLRHPVHSWRLRQLVDENTATDYRRANGAERGATALAEAKAMSAKKPTAIEKRARNTAAPKPFVLAVLKQKLPLVFPRDPNLPPSPKPHYRSAYRYLGFDDLDAETLEVFSPFEIAIRLFDYSHLEPLGNPYLQTLGQGAGTLSPGEYVPVEPLPPGAKPVPSRSAAHLAASDGWSIPATLYRI